MIIIPIKPTMTANHLNNPTFSISKKIKKIVVKIGAEIEIVIRAFVSVWRRMRHRRLKYPSFNSI